MSEVGDEPVAIGRLGGAVAQDHITVVTIAIDHRAAIDELEHPSGRIVEEDVEESGFGSQFAVAVETTTREGKGRKTRCCTRHVPTLGGHTAYGERVELTPTFLAAVASAGVPGLDPVSVEALPSVPDQDYDVAFVQDTEHRRWVVRAPRSELAGARMDLTVTLLQLLARRLPFTVPAPRGFVELKSGGRAMIYPYLPGHNLDFESLPAGAGPAAELGRALAALHNTDPRLFDEAGMPTYDTDSYRTRRLAELDRAAESGRVPTALLARWERALEDVALWRFAPTPVHGDLTGDQVLAVFEDDSDASTGRIRGLTGWEDAKVADPADDFAALVDEADPATVETVLEAYAHARVERPDPNLLVRARLAAELTVLAHLMRADARGDDEAIEGLSSRLRRLDEEVHAEDASDDYRRTSLTPVALRGRATPPPEVTEEDDDEDVEFEPMSSEAVEAPETDESSEDDELLEESGVEEPEVEEPDVQDSEGSESEVAEQEVAEPISSTQPVPMSRLGLDLEDDEDDEDDDDMDSTIEDASHDDEVAWTPRTFGSPATRDEVVAEPSDDEHSVHEGPDEADSVDAEEALEQDDGLDPEDLTITRPVPRLVAGPETTPEGDVTSEEPHPEGR